MVEIVEEQWNLDFLEALITAGRQVAINCVILVVKVVVISAQLLRLQQLQQLQLLQLQLLYSNCNYYNFNYILVSANYCLK